MSFDLKNQVPMKQAYVTSTIILCAGLSLLTVGVYFPSWINSIVEQKLSEELPLLNGSRFTERWSNPQVSVYLRLYLFNLTNPIEVERSLEKPRFRQLGPYTFRNPRRNIIHGWRENDTLLEYETLKYYHFEASLSNGTLDDLVTTINIPNLAIIEKSERESSHIRGIISFILKKNSEGMIVRTKVRKLIFEGYETPSAARLSSMKKLFKGNAMVVQRFGLLFGQNGTSNSGFILAHTGKQDIKRILSIAKWNNQSSLDCWPDFGNCNMINGTDGSFFSPSLSKNDVLYIFASEFNRSLHVKFSHESMYKGLNTFVYKAPKDLFSPQNEANRCFCHRNDTHISEEGFCSLSGVVDLSSCQPEQVPLVLSAPHFFDGHPSLVSAAEGLNPQAKDHESTIEVEPITGTPMRVFKRVQINVRISSRHSIREQPRYPDMIFPIFWLEESFNMDQNTVDVLNEMLFQKIRWGKTISICLIIVGILLVFMNLSMLVDQAFPNIGVFKMLQGLKAANPCAFLPAKKRNTENKKRKPIDEDDETTLKPILK